MSGRPFADPWRALTMDIKQLKALRAEANRADAKPKKSLVTTTSSSTPPSATASIAWDEIKSDPVPPKAEYIKATTTSPTSTTKGCPRKSAGTSGDKATSKHRTKVSWYKTLNHVRSLRSLKLELAPAHAGKKVKSILKGPGDLKRDPGAPAPAKDGEPQYTKISRRVVCPEALELGHEKFEVRDGDMVVLRMLSRQEIEGYAGRTKDIREQRRNAHHHGDGDSDGENHTNMVNEVVSGLANLATMFLHKK